MHACIPGELGFVIVVDVYVLEVLGHEIYRESSLGFHNHQNLFCFSFFILINFMGAILGYVVTKLLFMHAERTYHVTSTARAIQKGKESILHAQTDSSP